MDRTVIDTWKAEEKEFGEKLHNKLTVLTTLIQPPTDEFKKCFVQDMFLKPNQKAFFHVMHYLFTLLDPVEFKKRFYWPIADKKSEANFRSSTVQYLMHLNEKHNLQWANVKSYLVVMPGGMKFIVFLLDFIDFIVKELIKQREKSILGDMTREQFSEFNIDRMRAQNKVHKEYASRYVKAIELQIANLKENTEILSKHIESISIPNIKNSELLDDSVLMDFAASNRQLFRTKINSKVEKMLSIEQPLMELKEKLDRFQNHEAGLKYDKEMVKRSLVKIKVLYPNLEVGPLMHGSDLQLRTLLNAFNRIYPDMECNIMAMNQQDNSNDFIGKELSALKTEILQVETQATKFMSSTNGGFKNPQTKITPVRQSAMASSDASILFSKFVNTPPIKLDIIDNKLSSNPRLPFLDDFALERSIESFCFVNQQNTLFATGAPRSAKKCHDSSMKLNQSTVGKSKIIDPLKLLRTLNKDSSRSKNISRNLSSLASKWKKHEDLFGPGEGDTSLLDFSGCKTMVSLAVDSPMSDKISKTVYQLETSGTSANTGTTDGNILFPRKISAVKKVQDASMNFQNLSTSPSGRLDPLVPFDPKEFPKILLNDRTLLENSPSNKLDFFDLFNADKSNATHEDINNKSFRANKKATGVVDENDQNASNIGFGSNLNDGNFSSDAIFDISDGVLKDVTM